MRNILKDMLKILQVTKKSVSNYKKIPKKEQICKAISQLLNERLSEE